MNKNMYLLGATTDNELVFAEFGNEFGYFAASFVIVHPFPEDDPYVDQAAESWIDAMDKNTLYDWCNLWDCRPSELAEELLLHEGIDGVVDCSCGPAPMHIDGKDWYFETVACGQCDPRDYMFEKLYCSQAAFDMLMNLWDRYHLKDEVDDLTLATLQTFFMEQAVQDKWIEDYIHDTFWTA